jgi:diguanylate cyclase (GGDEF)-like protein
MANLIGIVSVAVLALVAVGALYLYWQKQQAYFRAWQENALSFSTLDVDNDHLLTPAELVPSLENMLDRFMRVLRLDQAAICIAEGSRNTLPAVQRGFSPEFLHNLEKQDVAQTLIDMAYRRGGLAVLLNIAQMPEPVPPVRGGAFERLRQALLQQGIDNLTAASLQTSSGNFGVVIFAHGDHLIPSSKRRVLLALAMQIGTTLENYVMMHSAHRRTKEYELLTQIGQAISSQLDPDEVLRTIHKELGLLFDTQTFYIAFHEGDEVRFEFHTIEGKLQPKHSRKWANHFAEYVIRTGQPLLMRSNLEQTRARLGLTAVDIRPAKCYVGVPIIMRGKPAGVMAALNYDCEHVYDQRDLDVLQTAAGQVAVAVENARLFAEEQRRARYLGFLNNVSRTAISSQDAEQMLDEIVREIQANFRYDHIGIGMLDYVTKEIEIKAEAGSTAQGLGRRLPLGTGVIGKVARSNEMMLVPNTGQSHLMTLLPDARSVLCLPLTYGETLLGVLNVESRRENAFPDQEVLILRTLADLLATAVHNAFVFQKLQQQSITDGLTGIKTRRFFLEAVTAEWKRASRSGRPFSVVLADMDKFKEVNDKMGHLEGDLVLARVGRLLEQKCRQSNVVARYGGDEFVILMPETGVEQAQILSERLRLWIATDPMLNERHITGSFGVASYPLHGSTVEEIIRVADAGMYVSKHAGGNQVSTAEDFQEREPALVQRLMLSSFIEGFLQREHTGLEHVEELVTTLKKFAEACPDAPEPLMDAISALARAAETKALHSAGHGESASRYGMAIARMMDFPEEELSALSFALRVHDVGKIVLPEKILCKPGPLTPEEYYLVKLHSNVGAEIVEALPNSEAICAMIKHHHERFGGGGYPDGIAGEQIPLAARILAVVDAYTNMVLERPFAQPKTQKDAAAELQQLAGKQFDPEVVRVFVQQVLSKAFAHASD